MPPSKPTIEPPASLDLVRFCCLRDRDHNTAFALTCLSQDGLKGAAQLGKDLKGRKNSESIVQIIAPGKVPHALAFAALIASHSGSRFLQGTPYVCYKLDDETDVLGNPPGSKKARDFLQRFLRAEGHANCLVIIGKQEFCRILARTLADMCKIPNPSGHMIEYPHAEWATIDFPMKGGVPYTCTAWEGGFMEG